jgi:hypothetical protein
MLKTTKSLLAKRGRVLVFEGSSVPETETVTEISVPKKLDSNEKEIRNEFNSLVGRKRGLNTLLTQRQGS